MQVFRLSYPFHPDWQNPCAQIMAIGDFDGIHLGHQEVIRRTIELKQRKGIPASVMTFHPHPRKILGHPQYERVLTPLECKVEHFETFGVDCLYIFHFDEQFSMVRPEAFVEEVLKPLGVETVVVGFDFTFGHRGKGNTELLRSLCEPRIGVQVVEPFLLEGTKVSSTLIREELCRGNVEKVRKLLGRPYAMTGRVVRGDGRGRALGFPTANITLEEPFVIPADGVYAVNVILKERAYWGVMNLGARPTFAGAPPTLEVHIFDFDKDIYGEKIKVEFLKYMRRQMKFSSAEELTSQIRQDVQSAKKIFATEG